MSQKPGKWERKCICSAMHWDYRKHDFKRLLCFFSKWEMWLHLFFPFLQLIHSISIYVPINTASHSQPQILLRNWFLAEYDPFFRTWRRAWQSSTFICPLVLNWQFLLWVQELLKVMVSTWTSSAACHTLPSWWSAWRDLAQNKGSFALKTCHLARSHLSGGVSSKSAANTRTAKLSLKSVASLMISTKWG